MKPVIDGFLIVEGTNDKAYISSLFDGEIVSINGYDFLSDDFEYILELSKIMRPIILTDSDEAGKEIRKKLKKYLPNSIDVEVDISKCDKRKKHGVAECGKNELISKLQPYTKVEKNNIELLSQKDILNLGLNNKERREEVARYYHLGKCNSKQLVHRLSLLKISVKDISDSFKGI